jgi:LCP family protein required for cell wall assembly
MNKEKPVTNNNSNTPEEVQESVKKTELDILLSRIKRRLFKHLWLVRGTLVAFFILIIYLLFLFFQRLYIGSEVQNYVKFASNFMFAPPEKVRSTDGRTNIVVLGRGGAGHEAPDLTDTIIFVSIDSKQENIDLISLPRDIWITSLRAKLNSIYYWGEQKQDGSGGVLTKSIIEEVVGEPIHYFVVIDFSGFVEIVDVVGGIEVDVENSFTDEFYPISGKENDTCGGDPEFRCRYETLVFEKGPQMMDGERALKFVRSRQAEGDEGTDLARAKRQQKVLKAIEKKILSREILLSPKKLISIKDVLLKNTETDLEGPSAAVLARWVYEGKNSVNSHSIPEEILINPPYIPKYDNLYVFIPEGGDWTKLHKWVDCTLGKSRCD